MSCALSGIDEVVDEPWFATGGGRATHADELDPMVADWIAQRDFDEVVAVFEEAGAAIAPIYDIKQVMEDPQYAFLKTFITIDDDDLGPMRMQNVMFRMSDTPGEVRSTGRSVGQDNDAVFQDMLNVSAGAPRRAASRGVI